MLVTEAEEAQVRNYIILTFAVKVLDQDLARGFQDYKFSDLYEAAVESAVLAMREELRLLKRSFYQNRMKVEETKSPEHTLTYKIWTPRCEDELTFHKAYLRTEVRAMIEKYLFSAPPVRK
ncbi:hypothetical protein B0H94_11137 [Salsuginibacillus halophilus]|uniref:Uncharacterized protein n=1 Tax=Salsuginibacillus halophilus TaxID=517424 RepID=A0A2P8HAI0_9BACI|nr:hypothetical protein [Salsuginibacillus halophilus]PSL43214.1 hypothetical protein B0H94_11137 [Salsuginibacillus halophilus]